MGWELPTLMTFRPMLFLSHALILLAELQPKGMRPYGCGPGQGCPQDRAVKDEMVWWAKGYVPNRFTSLAKIHQPPLPTG